MPIGLRLSGKLIDKMNKYQMISDEAMRLFLQINLYLELPNLTKLNQISFDVKIAFMIQFQLKLLLTLVHKYSVKFHNKKSF